MFSVTAWRKSIRSASNGNCVEVAAGDGQVGMRDSKDPAGLQLAFDQATWQAFIADVKSGLFDKS